MHLKPISVDPAIHRATSVRAAMSGQSMRAIAERALKIELERMAIEEQKEAAKAEGSKAGA
jgi:hypothetical protein